MKDQPTRIRLTQQAMLLEVDWEDGTTTRLTAATLRTACRCGPCRSAIARSGRATTRKSPPADLRVTLIEPMGPNALNLHFSDGHARGIYPFPYLRVLGTQESG